MTIQFQNSRRHRLAGLAIAAAALFAPLAFGAAPPVKGAATPAVKPFTLLISIDGLKPEAVLDAAAHGLDVPNLRAFMTDGVYSTGVTGVLPTLTYPSHMTIMTGVAPGTHGIYANTTFDPYNRNDRGWYWYTEDVHVPTLWDAAAAAHLRTANVYWPTSVGAHITYNLPQIWRSGTPDDQKLQRAVGTPGLETSLRAQLGPYPGGEDEHVADDEVRARFAIRLIETRHPDFITVYLTGLDTEQHASGPFSPQANAVLERLDAVVGSLRAAAQRVAPERATVCVISDHGFAAVQHDVNLYSQFLSAGLFSLGADHKISAWQAMPWPAGGSAAVMLADPNDTGVRARTADLLATLAADPDSGIARIWSHDDIVRGGGFPDAAFLVEFKIGYELGYDFGPRLIAPPASLGMHGYPPGRPEMLSSFFLLGPGVPHGRSVGPIDMRSIAPTLARLMHVKLDRAELPSLSLD